MLGEATLDALGTFLGEAIRLLIQIAALQLGANLWVSHWSGLPIALEGVGAG
jgi:hypothetical protein